MKKIFIVGISMMVVVTTAVIACNSTNTPSDKSEGLVTASQNHDEQIERGRYLVTIMGCNDCHSPKKFGPAGPETDSSLMFGGHVAERKIAKVNAEDAANWVMFNHDLTAFVGPWGVSYAANISSDKETGIGMWNEEQFFRAMREGKYKGAPQGRALLPPMPWIMYRHSTDEDLRAIFTYLKSTPPIKNKVPSPIPPDQISKL
jgi:hypothetical protein